MQSTLRHICSKKTSVFKNRSHPPFTAIRLSSTASHTQKGTEEPSNTNTRSEKQPKNTNNNAKPPQQPRKKSIAQMDEELRQKMSGLSGDGGDAGVEYEDGQPVAMKRSVKNNMFRYI